MKIAKALRLAGMVAVAALWTKMTSRPIGPCSPELEFRCSMVNANKSAIDAWREAHPGTKLDDYDIWFNHIRT